MGRWRLIILGLPMSECLRHIFVATVGMIGSRGRLPNLPPLMKIGSWRGHLSDGCESVQIFGDDMKSSCEYWVISMRIMIGELSFVKSKVIDVDMLLRSCTVNVQEQMISAALRQSCPYPLWYVSRGGSRISRILSMSQRWDAALIPPVDVGLPESIIGFGSGMSISEPFIENTVLID